MHRSSLLTKQLPSRRQPQRGGHLEGREKDEAERRPRELRSIESDEGGGDDEGEEEKKHFGLVLLFVSFLLFVFFLFRFIVLLLSHWFGSKRE